MSAGKLIVGGVCAGLLIASPALMSFIQKWESGSRRVLVVYADKLAGNIPTVCNGITRHVTDTPIVVGERWTTAKCEAEEARAMEIPVQIPLAKCFKRRPPQSVFDAASSHAWNFGVSRTCASVSMHMWNRGEWALGCERLYRTASGKPNWSHSGGKFYRGLQNRRRDEYRLCMRDVK